jgi:hypothetical protein
MFCGAPGREKKEKKRSANFAARVSISLFHQTGPK